MSERTPSELIRTYLIEVVRDGHIDLIDELALPDMVDEANLAYGGPPGRAGLRQHVIGFRRHITELELSIERVVADDQQVMAWWSFHGRHTGPWLGKAPTGEPIDGTVFSFFDLARSRIARYGVWLHAGFEPPVVFDSGAALGRARNAWLPSA